MPEGEGLHREWNLLAEKMQPAEIFYTYEWSLATSRAYGQERRPLLLLGYSNGVLAGIAVLAVCGDRRVEFMNANTADYCDFISDPEHRPEFARRVLAELRRMGMRSIVLTNLPRESPTTKIFDSRSNRSGFHNFCRKAYDCAQVQLATPEQRESVHQTLAGKKSVRRDLKALARQGELRLKHLRAPDELADVLPDFFCAHVARFLDKGRISNIARPERRLFLSELARLLSDAGWMRLSMLMSGERKIAWNYGFEFGGSWFWYQPTFDTAWGRHFPGFCLLTMLVREAADREAVDRVDLGLGDESYKARLATVHRETVHVTLCRSYASHVKTKWHFGIAQSVKKMPRLERVLRAIVRPGWTTRAPNDETDLADWAAAECQKCHEAVSTEPVTLELLARVVMHYSNDEKILAYALRAADNLRSSSRWGFAEVNRDHIPVKIFWRPDGGELLHAGVPALREAKI